MYWKLWFLCQVQSINLVGKVIAIPDGMHAYKEILVEGMPNANLKNR